MARTSRSITLVAGMVLALCTAWVPAPSASTTSSVHVYFLKHEKVVSVHRDVTIVNGAIGTAALKALIAGPTQGERAAGIASTIPAASRVRGLVVRDGTADVDFNRAYESGGGSLSMSARLMEVVFTLTQFATVHDVVFRINGQRVTSFGGEGIVIDHPMTRTDYASFMRRIFIDSPARGETVTSPVTVRGLANVFEGQFQVEVANAAGRVLARVPAMAAMGHFAAFAATLRFQVGHPGAGTVTGFDRSAKNGARVNTSVVPVWLR